MHALRNVLYGFFCFGIFLTNLYAEKPKNPEDYHRISYGSKMAVDQAIEINIDHRGVKLDTITFSGNKALLVAFNRTPNQVKGSFALSLYDKKDKLIAAATHLRSGIKSGKQGSFRIEFDKFMSDFSNVVRFQLVHVIVD